MEVFNVTYKVFLPKISKLDPVKLLDQTTSSQELHEATAPRHETAPGAQSRKPTLETSTGHMSRFLPQIDDGWVGGRKQGGRGKREGEEGGKEEEREVGREEGGRKRRGRENLQAQ